MKQHCKNCGLKRQAFILRPMTPCIVHAVNHEWVESPSEKIPVAHIYWEENMPHGDERMIFELADGRKMELAVYANLETIPQAITNVHFQEIYPDEQP